jgi:S-adenosylmethionine hydrolase
VSKTFHGRDIFAPVAAWLTKSWQTSSFGEPIDDFVRFAIPRVKVNGNQVQGAVLRVDHFGNLITNVAVEDVPDLLAAGTNVKINVGNAQVSKVVQTFAEGAAGEVVGLIGSSGYLEISVNKGNASRTLGVGRGAEVTVELANGQ